MESDTKLSLAAATSSFNRDQTMFKKDSGSIHDCPPAPKVERRGQILAGLPVIVKASKSSSARITAGANRTKSAVRVRRASRIGMSEVGEVQ
jgi:hypothetical protein